ncbi:GYD domain-containing protein [Roseateles oligotrophus]|uniref:GYD domain-containing protein n=1 Tax=Roseateles oligotrophus TaxID=1769250 RepID=A0ABT2YMK3_9BURK|nr:GYD domain-containing protein [Roseateles oligotrophus]MCV2371298.1 GYD domain-containing protein [Roseateles oligotrophus]
MPNFVILTNSADQAVPKSRLFEPPSGKAAEQMQSACPAVKRLFGYSLLGPWDHIDIFSAPDMAEAGRALRWLDSHQTDTAETCTAMPWADFKQMLQRTKAPNSVRAINAKSGHPIQNPEQAAEPNPASIQVSPRAQPESREGLRIGFASRYDRYMVSQFITASQQYFERSPAKR